LPKPRKVTSYYIEIIYENFTAHSGNEKQRILSVGQSKGRGLQVSKTSPPDQASLPGAQNYIDHYRTIRIDRDT